MFTPSIIPLMTGLFALTPQQENDSMRYLQSLFMPMLFEHCKTLQRHRTTVYDEAWTAWSKKNERAIARGEEAFREFGDRDAIAAGMLARAEADSTLAKVKAMPATEQAASCSHALAVARDES